MVTNVKKALLLFALPMLFILSAMAHDSRLAGVWKYQENLDNMNIVYFIKISIEDGNVFIRTKIEGINEYHHEWQTYREAENIEVNSDGSISFDVYSRKNEYDNDDHMFWTSWTHYIVKYKGGGRLHSIEKWYLYSHNSDGRISKDMSGPSFTHIYYNEKDNW